ncbi:hypothetical protein [Nocardioides panzhihuensis]|uniref:DNA-binding protein n=1 Tax=Nocardioides panzhihuensis TaxID=860243 RepID=A0A7Z0DJ95_9ACTN|nr:hypothetical protein [Nocardioides panzhihuensis]NYI76630.1 hypothetical protein [Nocardioides panzhihuensis]
MSATIWNSEAGGTFAELPPVVPLAVVAKGLGRSLPTIHRWATNGTIPAVHIPGENNQRGVLLEDLIDFCTPKRVQPINRGA